MTAADETVERLDDWLRFDPAGTCWILSGKVELGQGIHEALAIMVADELGMPLDRVRIAPVDTATSRDEGLTAGSRSVQEAAVSLRAIAATARRELVAAAATWLGVGVGDLTIDDGVATAPGGGSCTFAQLASAGTVLAAAVDPNASLAAPADRRWTGSSPLRRDMFAKVTGGAAFITDLDLPGMLHGRIARPPAYGARLLDVDEAAIRAMPGVVSVVRDGDFLGVVAEREDQAIAGLKRAQRAAVWSGTAPLPDASDPRYLLAMPSVEIVVRDRAAGPAVSSAASGSVPLRTVSAEYSREHLAHASLSPSCGIAVFDDGGLTVWSHSQGIFRLRHEIALVLGLDRARVRVRHAENAGCYGHNGADDAALDAALLARAHPGHPVRVQWTREDEFTWEPYGPAMLVRMAADLGPDGAILAWRHDLWGHGHEARPSAGGRPPAQSALLAARHLARPFVPAVPKPPRGATSAGERNSEPYYTFPSDRVVDHFVPDGPLRVSSLRALGAHANVFAIESFMDELAAATDSDPVELRLRHLDDPRARAVITAVTDMAAREPLKEDDALRGRGLAFSRYKNRGTYAAVIAEVELGTEIRVRKAWAAVDAGTVVSRSGLLNQIEGGIMQATSWTLHEAVRTDGAAIATRDWETYRTLRFTEAPELDVVLIDHPDLPPTGAGEAVTGPTSAAIANAVANATGIRMRDMPFTRQRFIKAVG